MSDPIIPDKPFLPPQPDPTAGSRLREETQNQYGKLEYGLKAKNTEFEVPVPPEPKPEPVPVSYGEYTPPLPDEPPPLPGLKLLFCTTILYMAANVVYRIYSTMDQMGSVPRSVHRHWYGIETILDYVRLAAWVRFLFRSWRCVPGPKFFPPFISAILTAIPYVDLSGNFYSIYWLSARSNTALKESGKTPCAAERISLIACILYTAREIQGLAASKFYTLLGGSFRGPVNYEILGNALQIHGIIHFAILFISALFLYSAVQQTRALQRLRNQVEQSPPSILRILLMAAFAADILFSTFLLNWIEMNKH